MSSPRDKVIDGCFSTIFPSVLTLVGVILVAAAMLLTFALVFEVDEDEAALLMSPGLTGSIAIRGVDDDLDGLDHSKPMVLTLLCAKPLVRTVDFFMSRAECAQIVEDHSPHLHRSTVVSAVHESGSVRDDSRTSSTAFLPRGSGGDLLQRIEDRAALITGIPRRFLETMQIVRYEPGQKYEPHHDYFQETTDDGGNRTTTVLVYLNDLGPEEEAGHTFFPEADVRVEPKVGRAVVWQNCSLFEESIACDAGTLHGGEPPRVATKYALNLWFRSTVQDANI